MVIESRRKVPNKVGYGHAGQHASLAVGDDGSRAWGFGNTEAAADKDAVKKVQKLRDQV